MDFAKMKSLKIMHVWDQAGVACLLSKQHRTDGHKIDIYKRTGFDPFGILEFYNEPEIDLNGPKFLDFVTEKSANYDIIHIHSIPSLVPKIRKKFEKKKIVLHYHGSDVRKKSIDELREYNQYADEILVATIDLVKYLPEATYIPNPVDTEQFVYKKRNHDKVFTIYSDRNFPTTSEKFLKNKGFNLEIDYINRTKNPIPYSDMLGFISQYGTYIDLRFFNNELIQSNSKTALECLAAGLRVLGPSLKYEYNLPHVHRPKYVAEKLMAIYYNLISK